MLATLLLSTLLSAGPVVSVQPVQCVTKCPVHKPKANKKPTAKVVVTCHKPTCGAQQQQQQTQQQQVVVVVGQGASIASSSAVAMVVLVQPTPPPAELLPVFGVGVRAALGLWPCPKYAFALVGVRARFPVAHLGVDLATQFYYGHSLALLVYPVQGLISWHLDGGALLFYHAPFSAGDVNRTWDLLLGTGLEIQVLPHLSVTADLRTTMPNPIVLTRESFPDAQGRHLNAGDVVANSFWHSQFMVGLMLHTW